MIYGFVCFLKGFWGASEVESNFTFTSLLYAFALKLVILGCSFIIYFEACSTQTQDCPPWKQHTSLQIPDGTNLSIASYFFFLKKKPFHSILH